MDTDIDEDVSIKKYLRMLSEGLCMAGTYYSLLSADLYFTNVAAMTGHYFCNPKEHTYNNFWK